MILVLGNAGPFGFTPKAARYPASARPNRDRDMIWCSKKIRNDAVGGMSGRYIKMAVPPSKCHSTTTLVLLTNLHSHYHTRFLIFVVVL